MEGEPIMAVQDTVAAMGRDTASSVWRKRAFWGAVALCVVAFLAVAGLALLHVSATVREEADTRAFLGSAVDSTLQALELSATEALLELYDSTGRVVEEVEEEGIGTSEVRAAVEETLRGHPRVTSLAVAYAHGFAPHDVSPDQLNPYGLFGVWRYRDHDGSIIDAPLLTDYTVTLAVESEASRRANSWYLNPLETGGTWTLEPYVGDQSGQWWSGGYGAPFHQNGLVAGVVSADLRLDAMQGLISDALYGTTPETAGSREICQGLECGAYGFIVSGGGQIILHPNLEEFLDVPADEFNPCLSELLATHGGFGESRDNSGEPECAERIGNDLYLLNHLDQGSGRAFWIGVRPLATMQQLTKERTQDEVRWWVGIALDQQMVLAEEGVLRNLHVRQVALALAVTGLLLVLSIIVFRGYAGSTAGLWAVSATFSVLALVVISYLWLLTLAGDNKSRNGLALIERPVATMLSNRYDDILRSRAGTSAITQIPTGAFIQSAEFTSANNVVITGYIWQRYATASVPQWLMDRTREPGFVGFTMPESKDAHVRVAYRSSSDTEEVVGWYFEGDFRQQFDYSTFPFDREEIWVRLQPKDFGRALGPAGQELIILLTPDLAAYNRTTPAMLPGLDAENFVLGGWSINETFFSYRENSQGTNFGGFTGEVTPPDLYFNIDTTRNFTHAFIANMIPLIVVTILLFAVQLTATSYEKRQENFGFDTANVVAICAALFFAVIVAHTSLRGRVAADGILYIEWIYFIVYGAILLVSINAILVASRAEIPLLRYRDNLVPRLLYWPGILGPLVAVTLFAPA